MVTPFTANGDIEYNALAKLIEFFINSGVHGLYILGTTGEWPLIDKEQRKQILEFVIAQVKARIPVMVHIGTLPVKDACELAVHAEKVGASAISSIPPYYFPFTEEDIEKYFIAILDAVSVQMPVLLYNIPGFARNVISVKTVTKLKSRYSNLIGLKDSQGNSVMLKQYLETVGDDGVVLIGSDDLDLEAFQNGCGGAISGNANIIPELFIGIMAAYQKGEMEIAGRLQILINELAKATHFGRVPLLKYGLGVRGVPSGYAMTPFVENENNDELFLETTIHRILLEFKELAPYLETK